MRTEEEPSHMSSDTLERGLTNRTIQLMAIGGAIGTGLFMGSGSTIHQAGPSVILVFLVIGAILFLIMRAMGEVLLHDRNYKSFQDFAHDLIGPWAGYVMGWTYWIIWIAIAMGEMIVIVDYFKFWFHNYALSVVATVALLLILLTMNLMTVKLFGELEFWFAIIKIVAIVALILVGLGMVLAGFTGKSGVTASYTHLWAEGGFFPTGARGFFSAFSVSIYSFIGTELLGTTAAEAQDPEKTIPKAIDAVPVRISIFYVGALATIMAIIPWNQIDPEHSPFVSVFSLAGLAGAASIMNFVVLTSASSSANSGMFSSSRMMFGLAGKHQAPTRFQKLSRHHVPKQSLLLVGALVFLFVPLLLIGGSVLSAFKLITTVASTLILAVWAMILWSYIRYRRRFPEQHHTAKFKLHGTLTPWIGLAAVVFMAALLIYFPETRVPMLLTPIWFVILAITWKAHRGKISAPQADAAQQGFDQPQIGA